MAVVSGCTGDNPADSGTTKFSSLLIQPHATVGTPVFMEDDGPFGAVGSMAYSRCPDQTLVNGQYALFRENYELPVSVDDPDNDEGLVHFRVYARNLRFYQYVSVSAASSQAIFRVQSEVLSESRKWAIPYDAAVTLKCDGGVYYTKPTPPHQIVWRGTLSIVTLHLMKRTNLDDEAQPPPPPSCDDPLTELIESEPNCASGGGEE